MELPRDSNDELIADPALLSDLDVILSAPSQLETFVYSYIQIHGPKWYALGAVLGSRYTTMQLQMVYAQALERMRGTMGRVPLGSSE